MPICLKSGADLSQCRYDVFASIDMSWCRFVLVPICLAFDQKLSTGQKCFILDNFVQSNLARIKFCPEDKYGRQMKLIWYYFFCRHVVFLHTQLKKKSFFKINYIS